MTNPGSGKEEEPQRIINPRTRGLSAGYAGRIRDQVWPPTPWNMWCRDYYAVAGDKSPPCVSWLLAQSLGPTSSSIEKDLGPQSCSHGGHFC